MQFSPANPIVQLCLQGMALEEQNKPAQALTVFRQAWDEASNDFEKFLSAHYLARHQTTIPDKLKWLQTGLQSALKINDETVSSALPALYSNIAKCYEALNEPEKAKENHTSAKLYNDTPKDKGPFYHGTRADLQVGDLLVAGNNSNYKDDLKMNHIYFAAGMHGAGLAAALAKGDNPERVYIVEPTGSFENDPNVTDKKFPGNPTRSYRSEAPLKVVGEVEDWERLTPEQLRHWREKLVKGNGEIIN